jgi:hypothetical protein
MYLQAYSPDLTLILGIREVLVEANRDDRFDLAIVDLDLPRWGILERCTQALHAGANEVLNMASSEKNIVRMVNRLVSE